MAEGRRFGVAADFSKYSDYAFKWAAENFLREGDELILIIVVKKTQSEGSIEHLWGRSGSPLIPLEAIKDQHIMDQYGIPKVSDDVTSTIKETLQTKKVTFSAKVFYGDAREKLLDAIVELPLDTMIMGSRGLGGIKKVVLGSVSNYVVNNAPCPVTVVKLPESTIA